MTSITDRIERDLGLPGLSRQLAERLEPSDLQSLLLEVYRLRAEQKRASSVLSDYETNRFVKPSAVSPSRLLEWDRIALSQLPAECEPVELAPVCPLGTCSAVAAVAQNWSVSTVRNTEVVSDPTNVLALEAARRRRALLQRDPRSKQTVHLASSHRVLRGQRYRDQTLLPHFRVFGLCSAGQDTGNYQFELQALALHLRFYVSAIRVYLGSSIPLHVSLTAFGALSSVAYAADDLFERIRAGLDNVACDLDPGRKTGLGYYQGLCFHIHAKPTSGQEIELADGGTVNWTRLLLSNAKERLVISGIGSERLCALFGASPST